MIELEHYVAGLLYVVCISETVARRLSEVNKALRLETVRITNQLNQCEKELHEEKTQRRFYEARVTELEADYSMYGIALLITTCVQLSL